MTDIELLELAAKAADYGFLFSRPLVSTYEWKDKKSQMKFQWNPLEDDGQALRLAVKLGLDVCIDTEVEREPHTHVIGFRSNLSSETLDVIEIHGNPYSATRRAIVRAAAEIGRSM